MSHKKRAPPFRTAEKVSIADWLVREKGTQALQFASDLAQRCSRDGDGERAAFWHEITFLVAHINQGRGVGDSIN
jgi:hypothetical protein